MDVEFNGAADLSQRATGLILRHKDTGQEMFVTVTDQFPDMGDMHIEGRRTVTLSVEMFVALAANEGYLPVDPNETEESKNGD